MTDRDDFLYWVKSTLYEAELAVHNGDAAPRRAIWSRNEPVSILGALRNAYGWQEVDEAFTFHERSFSDCTSYTFELQAYDVVGDMAYTAGLEHTSASIAEKSWNRIVPCRLPLQNQIGKSKIRSASESSILEQDQQISGAYMPENPANRYRRPEDAGHARREVCAAIW